MTMSSVTRLRAFTGHGVVGMFFLLRMAFWLTLVLALLPSGGTQPNKGPQLAASDAMVAATAAVSDVSNFCERQSQACDVGSKAAVVIGQRAQAGAKMVYDFISDQIAHGDTTSPSNPKTASTTVANRPVPSTPGSQTTLRPDDLAPAWQGPVHREVQPRSKPGA